ncbi:hypothetical protein C0063_12725 [Pseudoxanthomonas sp. KAs_5_3]|nr:hypothetical protein C0063_12725 [Pseudoxanthomonas sp. KAs_5_3]
MFLFPSALISVFPVFLMYINWGDADARQAPVIVSLIWLSILIHAGRGWARVRAAHRVQPILVTDKQQILSLLKGPRRARMIWFSVTMAAAIVSAVALGVTGRVG